MNEIVDRYLEEEELTLFSDERDARERFERYCDKCKGKMLIDQESGQPAINKYGEPMFVGKRVPTMSGLALALGFINRKDMIAYARNGEHKKLIQAMMTKMEEYAEQRLYDRNGQKGAMFALCNNFSGWTQLDKQEGAGEALEKLDAILDATKKNAIANGTNKLLVMVRK